MAMTKKERDDYERMRLALKRIATGYMTLKQIERDAEKRIGLSYEEVLEMSYENIRDDAREAVRNAALEEAASMCESWMMDRPRVSAEAVANQTMARMARHIRALKAQTDKDGAVCSCPSGDGSLRHSCAVHPPGDKDGGDCAKGAAKRFHGLVEEAIIWLETGGGRADSLCADLRKALAAQKQGDSDAG